MLFFETVNCSIVFMTYTPFLPNYVESQFCDIVEPVRERLLKIFEDVLYGDPLAAEYFLFHLLSTV